MASTSENESGLLPTPQHRDYKGESTGHQKGKDLPAVAKLLPTPNTLDGISPKTDKAIKKEMEETRPGRKQLSNLRDVVVRQLPTPTANEDATGTPAGKMQKMLGNNINIRGRDPEKWKTHRLNPAFVTQMMGFPDGWLDL